MMAGTLHHDQIKICLHIQTFRTGLRLIGHHQGTTGRLHHPITWIMMISDIGEDDVDLKTMEAPLKEWKNHIEMGKVDLGLV